jgi:hypothetical protein
VWNEGVIALVFNAFQLIRAFMKIAYSALAAFILAAAPSAALADAGNFTLINATGEGFSSVSIKRTGTSDWRPLPAAPGAGAASSVVFSDPDCAFDIRVKLASGGSADWRGVNLCGTSRLTLRRRPSGETWVDYD